MARKIIADTGWDTISGTGRYAREIYSRIKHHYGEELRAIKLARPASPLAPLRLDNIMRGEANAVFWSPQYMPPLCHRLPVLVTVHDLLQSRHVAAHKKLYFNHVLRKILKSADTIFTVSEFAKREISNWLRIPDPKIVVTYCGIVEDFGLTDGNRFFDFPYLLYVGNRRKHKNLARLIEAFAHAQLPAEIKLVFSGLYDGDLIRLASRFSVGNRIHFSGNIPDSILPNLYASAIATCYISLYEGFGLPIIESMVCGTPVVTSNMASMPEIAGNAALLVDPLRIDEIASGLSSLTFDSALRMDLINRGRERAKLFTWDSAARLVIGAINEYR